ncbi:MAG: hypothetical protein V2I33_22455 [Kangiellaceae bacterium]|jgi:hypothetical protein|nr:hypothetical protein [Kangiellaceae bacterium]
MIKRYEIPRDVKINSKVLTEFMLKHQPFLGETLTADTHQAFLDEYPELAKLVLFLSKESPSGLFKALASKYRGDI